MNLKWLLNLVDSVCSISLSPKKTVDKLDKIYYNTYTLIGII